ncbi:dynamin family protein [Halobacillus sp. Marseille-P3879]|uniref:dynamin family protein n=1 Tax=Halobacillus sp. Marseille-P3879 TaxID=2045014 RepID=UPI000C7A9948|nr:dynamin family protein [Halobacillus sp. Marseille-P3879]
MSVVTRENNQAAIMQIANTYLAVQENHPLPAQKALDLAEKIDNNEIIIGFAGHFSAGKSSMINYLSKEDILPSSPIPTSANVVTLSSGESYTTVFFNSKSPEKYNGSVSLDTIKELCKDGDSIKAIEISRPLTSIPENVKIIDTPGVDSTNDADRVVTEASLHLMDHMYYVMDYNHVQSEVNLNFLLEMQSRKIPFSLIINQVDKHREEELSFADFASSVSDSLALWGIFPEETYFTSLKEPDHPYSQVNQLTKSFHEGFEKSDEPFSEPLYAIIEECVTEYREQFETDLNQLEEELNNLERIIQEESPQGTDSVSLIHDRQKNQLHEAKDQFDKRIKKFIGNAYLMPSHVREKAEAYLESEQTGFKVGLLFSKKKTEEERKIRKQEFYQVLTETAEKNLLWPLKERLSEFMHNYNITEEELLAKVQKLTFNYPASERISMLIEQGASVTGDYILRYTDQLAKDIQKHFRLEMQEWWEILKDEMSSEMEQEADRHYELLNALEQKEKVKNKQLEIEELVSNYKFSLLRIPQSNEYDPGSIEKLREAVNKRKGQIIDVEPEEIKADVTAPSHIQEKTPVNSQAEGAVDADKLAAKVSQVGSILENIPGFSSLIEQLEEKQQRLLNKQYTIALFGAFSAGKSSFANALLGENVLPVSPNPTTATINKISPPTYEHSHRTILVKVKSESELLEDLYYAASDRQEHYQTLEEAYASISEWSNEQLEKLVHQKKSFISAFVNGYPTMKQDVGREMTIPWDELSSFVSQEETSCFIEWVEIYYDCDWTQKGITLVDTPGADSVNARHTDVSFEYIKSADAVLFVTYFNHPFSRPDASFLKQLGRVKDAFSMDKMFFIINAADLAASNEEKLQVEDYVLQQLHSFQIRHPRLYSLSSLEALEDKLANKTNGSPGFSLFEEKFERFLKDELTSVLKHSIQKDLNYASETLQSYIQNASLSQQEKDEQLDKLRHTCDQLLSVVHKQRKNRAYKQIEQKTEKQLYYAHERMMLNFNDYFKDHINPSVVSGTLSQSKELLKEAILPLLEEIEFEMNQELRAISLRMEGFVEELAVQNREETQTEISKLEPSFLLNETVSEGNEGETLQFKKSVEVPLATVNKSIKWFKGTKSFFEGNEKERMRDEIASTLSEPLKKSITDSFDCLVAHSSKLYEERSKAMKAEWIKEINQYYENQRISLESEINSEDLQERLIQLNQVI